MEQKETGEPRIAVSRLSFGFVPDHVAFERLARLNNDFGVNLGIEVNPPRWATVRGYERLAQHHDIRIVGVHGPLYANRRMFFEKMRTCWRSRDVMNITLHPLWLVVFGATQDKPRRYASPFEMAQALEAYLVVHKETIQDMRDQIVAKWRDRPWVLQENGWGPEHGEDTLSYDPGTIRAFADRYGIGTLLDTSSAALTGSNILKAYHIMQPRAIHLSDYRQYSKEENIVPGKGDHTGELRDIIGDVKHREGAVLSIEVWPKPDLKRAIGETLDFISAS